MIKLRGQEGSERVEQPAARLKFHPLCLVSRDGELFIPLFIVCFTK